jgi:hypothetical protein
VNGEETGGGGNPMCDVNKNFWLDGLDPELTQNLGTDKGLDLFCGEVSRVEMG